MKTKARKMMIDLTMLRQVLSMGGGQLWAMRREGATQLATAQDRRHSNCSVRQGEHLADGSYARVRGGVAVIPVRGPLVNRFDWGYFSYEEIERDIRLALGDERVSSIMLDVESPGGMAAGCDECAAFIRAASEEKPISAHIEGMGASAAYWLASAANHVTASPSAVVGSVGVIIRYTDFSTMFEKWGATKVEIMATQSPNKSHPPGSEEERAELQPIVDELASMFIANVADFRGVSTTDVLAKFGKGAIVSASVGLSNRMIDGVSNFDEALAALATRQNSETGPGAAAGRNSGHEINSATSRAAQTKENDMTRPADAASKATDATTANAPSTPETPAAAVDQGGLTLSMDADEVATANANAPAGYDVRAVSAEIVGIAQQAAKLGVDIDAAKAIADGVEPDALRKEVLGKLSESQAASSIVATAPHPSAAATTPSPLVSAAKAAAAQQNQGR